MVSPAVDSGSSDTGTVVGADGGTSDAAVTDDAGDPIDGGPNADAGDGGNPLEDPLSDFCSGSGTVVVVGSGGECAGEIAEETFQFALCVCDQLQIGSRLSVDAFDSRRGAYGSTSTAGVNILEDGHVGSNQGIMTAGKIDVLGSIYVASGGFQAGSDNQASQNLHVVGDAVQASSRTTVGRNAFVDGDVLGRFDIAGDLTVPPGATVAAATQVSGTVHRRTIPAAPVCRCDTDQLLDIPALTGWAATHNDNHTSTTITSTTWASGTGPSELRLPCGRYYLTGIQHGGGLRIVAEDRTVLFVDGDLRVDGPMQIDLEPGAEVDLFIAGQLALGASIRFGDPSAPSAVRTYVGGTGIIDLQASAGFGGNLYAPRASIVFGASARVYGAVFGDDVSFSGAAEVHYDNALRSAGDPCDEPDGGVGADGGVTDDAGVAPDGGVPPDAGPVGCTGCGECAAPEGCVIPPGEVAGECGPCQQDLDCCPPAICLAGQCRIQF